MKHWPLAILFLALASAAPAWAGEPKPFTAGSLDRIKEKYAGRPFILSLWSAQWCGHCISELTMLGKLYKTRKNMPLVLVSTDTPASAAEVQATLERLGLANADSWVFDDEIPERLRHAIDPGWHGDLPRTYLYDARHQCEAVAGVLSETKLRAWLGRHDKRVQK